MSYYLRTAAVLAAAVLVSGCGKSQEQLRADANKRACFANQRVLEAARDMLTLDDADAAESLDLSSRAGQQVLVDRGYIQTPMSDPGAGGDSYSHYVLQDDGHVVCTNHGQAPKKR